MRESKRRYKAKKLDSNVRRIMRYWMATIQWSGQLDFVTYIYIDDWSSGNRHSYITDKEFSYSVAVAIISFGTFGLGLGQLISEVIK